MTSVDGAGDGAGPEFNPAALDMLRRVGNGSLLVKMIDLFAVNAPERVEVARAGLARGDWRAVELAVHSLKSSAAQLGGAALQRRAAAVEHAVGAGAVDGLVGEIDRLGHDLARLLAWLEAARAAAPPLPPDSEERP